MQGIVDSLIAKYLKKQFVSDSPPADGQALKWTAARGKFEPGVPGDTVAHGISRHTEHANWKALYTDGSGDEQELSLVAAESATALTQFLAGRGTAVAPAFKGIPQIVSITFEDPVAGDNLTINHFDQAVTIREVHALVTGGASADFNLYMDATRTTETTKVFSSDKSLGAGTSMTRYTPDTAAIAANDTLFIDLSAVSGSPTEMHVTIRYTTS